MLDFDPVDRAGDLWERHFGDATAMRFVTSVMRAQQILLATLDATLKPYGVTFARYEVLVLLHFSRDGRLPLSKIGQRLQVHPTSVTNAIDRLVAAGLVDRAADETDRRRVFASLTPRGTQVVTDATAALMGLEFGVVGLDDEDQTRGFDLLRGLRAAAGDFRD
ncbi:MarR family winged helix-turn-helix transcriptional regulator [Lapillicoccus jejuensis]|uniref:DNA-binding MarR family transcriptional regulator n=1 Tax=Lapillicoccus jejuensis TaxID=402171 RepID=A0A542E4X2_9MICO|nr:MarR family transcriptional regulator [Lapillicoccus jejuensis]TQJ10329.1 DNA-binding MarR family transcriptional regulator [Lapillicoccus jejuensis]